MACILNFRRNDNRQQILRLVSILTPDLFFIIIYYFLQDIAKRVCPNRGYLSIPP